MTTTSAIFASTVTGKGEITCGRESEHVCQLRMIWRVWPNVSSVRSSADRLGAKLLAYGYVIFADLCMCTWENKNMSSGGRLVGQKTIVLHKTVPRSSKWNCLYCQQMRPPRRFSMSAQARQEQYQNKGPFGTRLHTALRNTKIQWKYRIPIGLGIAFLGASQFYRVQEREKRRRQEEQDVLESTEDSKGRPKKRQRIRPTGPW